MSNERKLIDMDNEQEQNKTTDVQKSTTVDESTNELDKIDSIVNEIVSSALVENKKVQISTYLDEDVFKKYIRFGKKSGKGSRARLINTLLREALKDY